MSSFSPGASGWMVLVTPSSGLTRPGYWAPNPKVWMKCDMLMRSDVGNTWQMHIRQMQMHKYSAGTSVGIYPSTVLGYIQRRYTSQLATYTSWLCVLLNPSILRWIPFSSFVPLRCPSGSKPTHASPAEGRGADSCTRFGSSPDALTQRPYPLHNVELAHVDGDVEGPGDAWHGQVPGHLQHPGQATGTPPVHQG